MYEPSEAAKQFKHGVYRHFKGGTYKTLYIARNSEDHEKELVVYQSLEKGSIWVRPLPMFLEHVERDGYSGPRFTYIGESA